MYDSSKLSSTFGQVCTRTALSHFIKWEFSFSLFGAERNPDHSSEQKCGVTGASIIMSVASANSNSLLFDITSGGKLFCKEDMHKIFFKNCMGRTKGRLWSIVAEVGMWMMIMMKEISATKTSFMVSCGGISSNIPSKY